MQCAGRTGARISGGQAGPIVPRRTCSSLSQQYAGRPTPLYHAQNLSKELGGAQVYFKREDLAHTGAHKINNALGQGLLTARMGKKRIIAETGAGQHGVATATVCAMFSQECIVYMGEEDIRRQSPKRVPHEAARRGGAIGHLGQQDAQGRHQRVHPGLGNQCRERRTT